MTVHLNKVVLLGEVVDPPIVMKRTRGLRHHKVVMIKTCGRGRVEDQIHKVVVMKKTTPWFYKLQSGMRVYMEGSITYRQWTDDKGFVNQIPEIIIGDYDVFSILDRN